MSYPDPGSCDGHPWTIGWGHTGPEVREGVIWTQEKADEVFLDDIKRFEAGVIAMINVPLAQGHFDALVSLAYNIGLGNLKKSTLLKKLNASDYNGASLEFSRWNKNGNKVMRGLVRRRAAEECLFNGASAEIAISLGIQAA
nr:lysozyme [Aeromonas sp. SG16]